MDNYKDKKDDTLVELTLLGNESAYEELVIRHEKSVKGTAYKVTNNEYSAEDAAQDAFVAAWVNLDSLKSRESFGSWVCSIAKNCANQLVTRYKSAVADISFELLSNFDLGDFDESGLLASLSLEALAEEERDKKLHDAVNTLNDSIRQVVTLHYFDGLSVSEIATKLSLPAGTVKWRLSEGRKQLRKEYGLMEKTYDENATLVEKVMREVEALKLWGLKNDKSGFEADYEAVLKNVCALADSKEKAHMLADVLLRGYWWLPGQKNDTVLAEIKKAAEESHNEDVMQSIVYYEYTKQPNDKQVEYMRNVLIPYLEEKKFKKALGYIHFWLAYKLDEYEEKLAELERVLEIATPDEVYHANALSAIKVEKILKERKIREKRSCGYSVTGETYKYIGGKLCFWSQPGYSHGRDILDAIFWNASSCDHIIIDPTMKKGDSITSSDGKNVLTCKEKGITVETSFGKFENCMILEATADRYGLRYSETTFCPGVGIVKQIASRGRKEKYEWQLSKYTVVGGEGYVPFAVGNRWEYECMTPDPAINEVSENVFEVTYFDGTGANISSYFYSDIESYKDTFEGNILGSRENYCDNDKLVDISSYLARASELAETKREKLHAKIASDVMNRIFATDPNFNPDYTENGRWNFFMLSEVSRENGKITTNDTRRYSFEWKDMSKAGVYGTPVLFNFIYDMLEDAEGALWSDKWVDGYHKEGNVPNSDAKIVIDVTDGDTVKTSLGEFKNCRRVSYEIKGYQKGWNYRNGKKSYWFADGIGLVKFSAPYDKGTRESIYELTEYAGTGEGYFPVGDGIFRKYTALGLENGWHGGVEYTFDENESGLIMFTNSLGTQDRENYLADLEKAKAKETK